MDNNVKELIERLVVLENEMKTLQDDKKNLFDEYKERLDIKAFKAAVQIAKIRSKLGDSEYQLDQMFEAVSAKITIS
tara:strand:+ start:41863 stop:42093 length:231 start_codon:yes stop_codon:yes gene_type:complete